VVSGGGKKMFMACWKDVSRAFLCSCVIKRDYFELLGENRVKFED
jgi:hypothetical protein